MADSIVAFDRERLVALAGQSLGPVAAIAVTFIVLLVLLRPSRAHAAVASLPRPPSALPFLGNTIDLMITHRHTLPTFFLNECLRWGGRPFVIRVLTRVPMVMIYSVQTVEDVLRTQFHKFGKGYDFAEALKDVFGKGIFVSEGSVWQHQRKLANHLLSTPTMRDIMDTVMAEYTEKLCGAVEDAVRSATPIDMKHLLELFATDVFVKIGFGVDLQFMSKGNHEFFDRFSRANQNLLYRQEQPSALWKLKQWLGVGIEKQQTEDVTWLDKFVYGIIQDSVAQRRELVDGQRQTIKRDLITLLLDNPSSQSDSKDDFDMAEIRDMAMAFISAGRDTTAFSMAWFMIMITQFPKVQEQIRAELWEKLPALMAGGILSPSKEQTQDLTYLEAAIKENLRLNPVIPVNLRESVEDVTLNDGTFLAAGTQVLIPAYAMARLPSIWGPDACEFKPERWINATNGKIAAVSPFKFVTFSAGPRSCPGKQFSMMEMKIALAALLAKYEFTSVDDPTKFQYETSLTLGVHGPVMMRVTPVPNMPRTTSASRF